MLKPHRRSAASLHVVRVHISAGAPRLFASLDVQPVSFSVKRLAIALMDEQTRRAVASLALEPAEVEHPATPTSSLAIAPRRKSLIATSLIVVVSLFVVVVNYSEKPYFLLQPVFGQTFSSHWMFSKQPYKAFKPHLGYVSIPKQEPLKLHCELCSIVSSSGQMLGQASGPQIDRSPCIWRMNNAPTRGFERDVGQRTTLRVVSHTSVPLLLQKPHHFFGQGNDTVYVVWGPLRNMRKDGKGIVYNMLRQAADNYPHARIYVTTEDRMNYCDMVFKKETGKDR
ncbi:Alpha-N-acetylgalactosaminide alpha-2,6-sialyltransferase 3 [Liparis tanakae]|uniref:Alpha-N-acetylgalactosaminide alpha-2,6-sialyltransferase 3 n=1 Tax=Liparis tanakae TaxID=230148 RepID=A0A4Z2JE44_9TELE|nr:Alpha-N-acetylgalactosaminide alpha-2,6-sialyltransferase 3 [Liparis tanakae]